MTVQNLAALAVRVVGVILLVKTLEVFVTIAVSKMGGAYFTMVGYPFLAIHMVWLAAALIMIVAPFRIAGALGDASAAQHDQPANKDTVSAGRLLHIAIFAIGLYFLVDAAKAFFSLLFYVVAYTAQGAGDGLAPLKFWQRNILNQTVMGVVSFGAALWFLFGTKGVARLIHTLRRA